METGSALYVDSEYYSCTVVNSVLRGHSGETYAPYIPALDMPLFTSNALFIDLHCCNIES